MPGSRGILRLDQESSGDANLAWHYHRGGKGHRRILWTISDHQVHIKCPADKLYHRVGWAIQPSDSSGLLIAVLQYIE